MQGYLLLVSLMISITRTPNKGEAKMEALQKAAQQVDSNVTKDELLAGAEQRAVLSEKQNRNCVYSAPLTANSHNAEGEVIADSNAEQENAAPSGELGGDSNQGLSAVGNGEVEPGGKGPDAPLSAAEIPEEVTALLPAELPAELPIELPKEEEPQAPPPLDGIHEYTADDGRKYIVTYKDGMRCGLTQIFNKDGTPEKEVNFLNNKIDGLCVTYENGVKRTETEFKEDKLHGVSKSFDETGDLVSEIIFENGVKHGEMKQYHKTVALNGGEAGDAGAPQATIKVIANFEEDKMSGAFATFSETGAPLLTTQYKSGEIHGTMHNFYTGIDGSGLQREAEYEQGKLHGVEKVFYSSGEPQSIAYYEYGKLTKPPAVFKQKVKPK